MHYYIDGYNLLFRVVRGEGDVSKRRQNLIYDLHQKISRIGLNATLVFDSKYFPGGSEKSNFDNLEILFSSVGDTADQLIIEQLENSEDPFNETVVTSDKKLAWYARLRSAKTVTVEEFIDLLNRRYRNKLKQEKIENGNGNGKGKETDLYAHKMLKPAGAKIEEGSEEFYLKAFEEEFKKIEEAQPKKREKELKEAKTKKNKRKFEKPEEEEGNKDNGLSDFERWMNVFERKLDEWE